MQKWIDLLVIMMNSDNNHVENLMNIYNNDFSEKT
jgi:hypothetical protein